MIDSERDPIIERIAREARRPAAVDPGAKARLLVAIAAEGAPGSVGDDLDGIVPRRGVTLSTGRFVALAAGLVGIGALLGLSFSRDSQKTEPPTVAAANSPSSLLPASPSDTVMTFVFVTHDASKVSVVGDFNQWDADATPMQRIANSNAWTVTVPLSAGRHLYSFYAVGADGEKWIADPNAPAAPDDGFGRRNSVILVGKGSAS
ncbi:MAG TPA: isoamylase early set domain-containing protein [Gemmatimonadaceae bacterium]|nr:isoamylase early set domain-containing protein [Gemmatimonadaceae bacterium]